jgi:signal transduction histidine kinase
MQTNNKLLYESESLKEAFAAIAHQWRQPLSHINAIVGSIDNRLYEQGVADPLLSKYLFEIEKITKEMSKSIDNYRGYFHTKDTKSFVKDLILNVKKSVQYILDENDIILEYDIEKELEFLGDAAIMQEIVITIINNAKDALISRNIYDPKIFFKAWREDDFLFIKICDNAGGMTKNVMQKIFEQNFTTKHSSEGTGLGLYMVKKLLNEKFNAEIDVKNRDNGVCFTLKLPRK